ncbi:hypothetical protein AMTR_s00009p00244800 [Amborella trichopoda]|uniref:APO domain-containing protein n=1 Tax=Amborella trichopoda TaxID=13333 RepID=W1NIP7_AMBTC|nr:hypothetical protein AMTR_s00009p00244800 [Amborella trichopoda]
MPIFSCFVHYQYRMWVCGEVHVGATPHKIRSCDVSGSLNSKEHTWGMGSIDDVLPCVESFHLYDRLGRAVTHEERLRVDRVPAIVELCMQSGVDVLEFPTRRYKFPAYSVAGKTIDFERRFPRDVSHGDGIQTSGFWMKGGNWEKKENLEINGSSYSTSNDTQGKVVKLLYLPQNHEKFFHIKCFA